MFVLYELTNVSIVVTRWFGGTNLLVVGLMRAYGGAAGRALDRAPRKTVVVTRRVAIEYPYECSGPIEGLLHEYGFEPLASEYGATVQIKLDVPERDVDAFQAELTERTAGRARVDS